MAVFDISEPVAVEIMSRVKDHFSDIVDHKIDAKISATFGYKVWFYVDDLFVCSVIIHDHKVYVGGVQSMTTDFCDPNVIESTVAHAIFTLGNVIDSRNVTNDGILRYVTKAVADRCGSVIRITTYNYDGLDGICINVYNKHICVVKAGGGFVNILYASDKSLFDLRDPLALRKLLGEVVEYTQSTMHKLYKSVHYEL